MADRLITWPDGTQELASEWLAAQLQRTAEGVRVGALDDIARLRGQRDVLVSLLIECDVLIDTIEPESSDESIRLEMLLTGIREAVAQIAEEKMAEGTALAQQGEPVAEVIWDDPTTNLFPPKPGKIIDASLAFMDSAPIGTKLYAAPQPAQQAEVATLSVQLEHALAHNAAEAEDAARYRWLRNRLSAKPTRAVSGSVRPALEVQIGRAYFDSVFRPRNDDEEQAMTLDATIDAAMAGREG